MGIVVRRVRYDYDIPDDLSPSDRDIVTSVKPYTATSIHRVVALIDAVHHVVQSGIQGAFVECGVWRGGSMMAVAYTLLNEKETARNLFLYDTFEGMSTPTDDDVSLDGTPASTYINAVKKGTGLCEASLEEVERNIRTTGYPADRVHYVKGKVEDTIPARMPREPIALLRLDTDWYESTRHELQHLFPRLATGGILIIDDYGDWRGARKATDEFLAAQARRPFLHRIDATGRLIVKC